jgi:hypothetical protein
MALTPEEKKVLNTLGFLLPETPISIEAENLLRNVICRVSERIGQLCRFPEVIQREIIIRRRERVMLTVKEDTDISFFEKNYLISKGWNPEIFKD